MFNSFMSQIRSSIYKLNNKGESKHPCFRPHLTSKKSVDTPFMRTQLLTDLYKEIRALYNRPHKPISFNLVHNLSCGIESYAFEKSMNATKVSFFLALRVSIIDVRVDK